MPSLGHGVVGGAPYSRAVLVSFSHTSQAGSPATVSHQRPRVECSKVTVAPSVTARRGLAWRWSRPHDQVLRNQAVGSRCSGAGSGPWSVAVIRTTRSSGPALA